MQEFLVIVLFAFSILYLIREFRKNFSNRSSNSCPKGCGACGATDLEKIALSMKKQAEAKTREEVFEEQHS